MNDNEDQLYSSTFAPLLRQKTIAIWSRHQVLLALLTISAFMFGTALLHSPFFSLTNFVLTLFLILDLIVKNGLSIWQLIALRLGLLLRQATGNSKATYSPITANSTVSFADIPGEDDNSINTYRIINTEYDGACFVWDSIRNEATAPLILHAASDQFAEASVRNGRADSFSAALHSLVNHPDIVRVTIQSRALLHPITKTAELEDCDSTMATEDITDLEENILSHNIEHDYVVSITVNPDNHEKASPFKINKAAASIEKVSEILADRVTEICGMLSGAGVQPYDIRWMNASQLRGQMKILTDPDANQLLDEHGNLPDDIPVQTSWREYTDHVAVGPAYARSYWISKWPVGSPVYSDWLSSLSRSPTDQQILTLVFHHRTLKEAKASFDGQRQEANLMRMINAKLDRPEDDRIETEEQTITRLKKENVANGGDIQFQGFVTILASSLEELEQQDLKLNMKFRKRSMHLDRQHAQQLARWVGALPIGLEGRQ